MIPQGASATGNAWLKVRLGLLTGSGAHSRDFMLPGPMEDLKGFSSRTASDADASIQCRLLMTDIRVPVKMTEAASCGDSGWGPTDVPLMDPLFAGGWTNHSERATLTSMLAALGVDRQSQPGRPRALVAFRVRWLRAHVWVHRQGPPGQVLQGGVLG